MDTDFKLTQLLYWVAGREPVESVLRVIGVDGENVELELGFNRWVILDLLYAIKKILVVVRAVETDLLQRRIPHSFSRRLDLSWSLHPTDREQSRKPTSLYFFTPYIYRSPRDNR